MDGNAHMYIDKFWCWCFRISDLKTQYCPLSFARCYLLVAIFVMLKILGLSFVARIELFNNNRHLAPVKNKTTTEARKA